MIASAKRKRKPTGLVLWQGPSAIDGGPIVVIATLRTDNRKTGPMVQVWILRADVEPHIAKRRNLDVSICGNCPHKGNGGKGSSCYVIAHQGPLQVYRAWQRGNYVDYVPADHDHLLRDQSIRMGAYGDPCAAPYTVWSNLARLSSLHTGYTHQHATGRNWRFRGLLMASCETLEQSQTAHARGWRTFRTMPSVEQRSPLEILCPATKGTHCADCGLCSGASGARSICIPVHGGKPVLSNYRKHITTT